MWSYRVYDEKMKSYSESFLDGIFIRQDGTVGIEMRREKNFDQMKIEPNSTRKDMNANSVYHNDILARRGDGGIHKDFIVVLYDTEKLCWTVKDRQTGKTTPLFLVSLEKYEIVGNLNQGIRVK